MAYPTERLFVHCFQIELEFGVLVFVEREPGKNTRSKDQQQTTPTYGTGPVLNPSHIGGRRALSPLYQQYLSRWEG